MFKNHLNRVDNTFNLSQGTNFVVFEIILRIKYKHEIQNCILCVLRLVGLLFLVLQETLHLIQTN
jgi:hypothetical protein